MKKLLILFTIFFIKINKFNAITNITVTDASLNPIFDKNVNTYNIYVDENREIITINSQNEENEIVTGIGSKSLKKGLNVIEIISYKNDKINKTYNLNIIRGEVINNKSSANLKTLEIENYDLEFDKDTLEYSIDTNNNILINYKTENPLANVKMYNNKLNEEKKLIKLEVTSEDKTNKKIYTINVNKIIEIKKEQAKTSIFDKKEFSTLELNLIKMGIVILVLSLIIFSFYFWVIKKRTNKVLNISRSILRR